VGSELGGAASDFIHAPGAFALLCADIELDRSRAHATALIADSKAPASAAPA
jgi:hypothetical protein